VIVSVVVGASVPWNVSDVEVGAPVELIMVSAFPSASFSNDEDVIVGGSVPRDEVVLSDAEVGAPVELVSAFPSTSVNEDVIVGVSVALFNVVAEAEGELVELNDIVGAPVALAEVSVSSTTSNTSTKEGFNVGTLVLVKEA